MSVNFNMMTTVLQDGPVYYSMVSLCQVVEQSEDISVHVSAQINSWI